MKLSARTDIRVGDSLSQYAAKRCITDFYFAYLNAREFAVNTLGHLAAIRTAFLARLIADMVMHPAYFADSQHSEGTALGALRQFRGSRSVCKSRQLRQLFKLADSSIPHAIFAGSIGNELPVFRKFAVYLGNTSAAYIRSKVHILRHGDEEFSKSSRSKS